MTENEAVPKIGKDFRWTSLALNGAIVILISCLPAESAPSQAVAYATRANSFAASNRFTEAYADLSQAIKLNDKSAIFYINRAQILIALKQYDKALEDVNRGLTFVGWPKYSVLFKGNILLTGLKTRAAAELGSSNRKTARKDLDEAAQITQVDPYVHWLSIVIRALDDDRVGTEAELNVMKKYFGKKVVEDNSKDIYFILNNHQMPRSGIPLKINTWTYLEPLLPRLEKG